ncbi:MAG: hypothetical protein ACE5EA_05235 [Nitrospirota bacterium]
MIKVWMIYIKTILIALVLIINSCGGIEPTGKERIIFFPEPCSAAQDTISICLNKSDSGIDPVTIDIIANDITRPVLSSAFDIDFNASGLEFNNSYLTGDFFEKDGGNPDYLVTLEEGSTNKIIIGVSLSSDSKGIKGSGTIISLQLRLKNGAENEITFSNNSLLDSSGRIIEGILWNIGKVKRGV